MKIVYVVGGLLSPNGMSQVLSQKINYLAENTDYELYMILTEKAGEKWYYEISSKVKYINFDLNFDELDSMPILKKIWHYRKKQKKYKILFTNYLMKIKPDITVSTCRREINFINNIKDGSKKIGEIHFNKVSYRQFNKKYLPKIINRLISKLWMNIFIRKIKKLDKFVVLSEEDKVKWTGIKNITVINNPLKYIPKKYSDCKNKKVIAVGRYTWQKGFDMLIEAWKDVEIKHNDWEMHIYGSGDNNLYQSIAVKNNLKKLYCHNSVKNIFDKYAESSFFVLSSRYEGFALVLAEAMSSGLSIISFDCPCGPKEIIQNGINGILIKQKDTHDLANKICFLIENENIRIQMGKKAIENTKRFNVDIIMQKWIDLFNEVLTNK